ncbi:MAG: ChaN family lipoprotein [Saprospiraceae bacterium]|nr:ChaN family lipoprotein [Saprospiraceae bacterium]
MFSQTDYQWFDKEGKKIDVKNVYDDMRNYDIIFFGEIHDCAIAHHFEEDFLKFLYNENHDRLVLGLEMFEADNQTIMNEYVHKYITTKNFEDEARLWKNYKTDYKPLIEFSRENNINVVASNIPRRYASKVFNDGIESLNDLPKPSKEYIAKLPIKYDGTLSQYAAMKEMAGHESSENFPMSQAIKDATMAHFIAMQFKKDTKFLHINGAYHSDFHQGILWYLNQLKPKAKMLTISTTYQTSLETLDSENIERADYILVVKETETQD